MSIIDGNKIIDKTDLLDTPDKSRVLTLAESSNKETVDDENLSMGSVIGYVKQRYNRSKDRRLFDETRWLKAYANYRGIYGPDVQFTETEKSQAFMKITKTKVHAAYAQILEILFASNKFPIGIEASRIPVGALDSVHFDPKDKTDEGKGGKQETSSTIARPDIFKSLGNLREKLEPVKEKLKEGPGLTDSSFTFEPAKEAAKEMDKKIQDQLEEAAADKSIRRVLFDMSLFGTGIIAGPFAMDKEYAKWNEKGEYEPIKETIADVSFVSIWDAYPDPDARNMEEAEYFVRRHKMSKTQLRQLKQRPSFRKQSIDDAISEGTNYIAEYWENKLDDSSMTDSIERYEVLEYWGYIDKEVAEDEDFKVGDAFKDRDQIQVNIWICNDKILRMILNPYTPSRIPYLSCPYELNPYSFFGIGIAENMEDTQLLMNGFMRLAVDNAVLSSNVVFEIDESNLAPGQDTKLYPGKIFRRQGGSPGQTIFATKFPNVTQECMLMFDKARQLADESTGMPSYSHGISGVMGTGRTAAGMSMLMGAAKENIKAVVRNIDDYILTPLGKAMFAFNMQFNFDKKYIGDLEVVAKGTESLMRNEVRSQKLMQFLQVGSNPMLAPFLKANYILREIAASLDLDPDKVVNDSREAAIQAEQMAAMNKLMGVEPQQNQGNPEAAPPSVNDPTGTGNGNIAPGAAPVPGEQGNTSPQAGTAPAGPPAAGQGPA